VEQRGWLLLHMLKKRKNVIIIVVLCIDGCMENRVRKRLMFCVHDFSRAIHERGASACAGRPAKKDIERKSMTGKRAWLICVCVTGRRVEERGRLWSPPSICLYPPFFFCFFSRRIDKKNVTCTESLSLLLFLC
jgi:hypothetical protein